jgi:hypothetical protein
MNPESMAGETMCARTERDEFRRRFAELRASTPEPDEAGARFLALQVDFERLAIPLRHALLASPLAWTEDEKELARWLNRACDEFSTLGYRFSELAAARLGMADDRVRAVVAATLFFMGETVKWDIAIAPTAPHDLRKVHTLMRLAMDGAHHRDTLRLRVDGREADCTLESLYFRVLLLSRFASGALNSKQIEILDAWMWLWMPVLSGVPDPPAGSALRADLDSSGGLQRGPRAGDGPSLYLPQDPIEAAYRGLIVEFHAGRIVPAEGIASQFRIEEHVAVLDLIKDGLSQSRRAPVPRAARRTADRVVEIHIGLAEIMAKAFAPPTPAPVPATLALVDGKSTVCRAERERDSGIADVYDPERRMFRVVDESETGLGLEGAVLDCSAITAGELVAVRLSSEEPLVLGKVVRCVASKQPGRIFMGVQRLSGAARLFDVHLELAARAPENVALLFVPGDDSCGRHDACLVSERAFAERAKSKIVAPADGVDFTLRLNRVRDRGRGWVLAGFEVATARSHAQPEPA